MDTTLQLVMPIMVPIAVAVVSHMVQKLPVVGTPFAKGICIAASFFTLSSIISLFIAVSSGPISAKPIEITIITGVAPMLLYIDCLALLPALLTSLLGTLALIYNIYYMSPLNKAYEFSWKFNRSYSFILLFIGAMVGVMFAGDLLSLLIFLELISICSYALISFRQKERASLNAAMKCIVITHVGSLALLIGSIVIYSLSGTLSILEIGQRVPTEHALMPVVFVLLLIAALPKSVQFPLHTWLPDGTLAPTSATVLFHVCGFQSGIYLIIRFFYHVLHSIVISTAAFTLPSFFGSIGAFGFIISLIGATTLVVGALNGLVETDLKRIIAYSTISGLGYVVIAVGLATPLAVAAGLFLMVAHALCFGLMFFVAGAVIYSTGKHDINEMGGLYRSMPFTSIFCALGCLALAAFPLLADFVGKYLLFQAALNSGSIFFLMVSFAGCILNAAVAMRLLHSVFMGKKETTGDVEKDPRSLMLLPMFLLSGILIIFGVHPTLPLSILVLPAVKQLGYYGELNDYLNPILTSGLYESTTVALFMIGLSFIAITLIVYSIRIRTAKAGVYEETPQPFLSGESMSFHNPVHGFHLYSALYNVLRIDSICRLSNVDRIYYRMSNEFSTICSLLLKYDIKQQYLPSILYFIGGALALVLLALLGV